VFYRNRIGNYLLLIVLPMALFRGAQPVQAQGGPPVWTTYTTRHGLASNAVSSIAVDSDGHVWVGTFGGGVSRFDGQEWFTYSTGHGLADDWVTAVVVDSDGDMWAGTYGGGLSRFDGTQWTTYTAADSGLANGWITALAIDRSGNLWVGTDGGGVSRFDGQSWQAFTPANSGLASFWVTALAADGDTLWVGTYDSGISRYDGRAWEIYSTESSALADDHINAITVDGQGWIWVGTDHGVNLFNGQNWQTYTAADGLADDHVEAIASDSQGQLWFGTAKGVSVFNGANWTIYTARNGLAADFVSAVAADPAGDLWFGTVGGGVSVLGQHRELHHPPPPVVLVHGWQDSEMVEESQFKYMARWLERDGFSVYYATGISPERNLYRNAQKLKETIERARADSGAPQVSLIAHSMGGLVARAYIESALYGGDVAQVFMLGTPQAGLDLWHGYLLRQVIRKPGIPSLQELAPVHMLLFNRAHHPRPDVSYYLIAGNYRNIDMNGHGTPPLHLPPGDGIVTLESAHALAGPSVYPIITADLHGWGTDISLLDLPSYLWPDRTYAHLRNQLRTGGRGYGMEDAAKGEFAPPVQPQVHTPFIEGLLSTGQAVTETVAVDSRGPARFYLTWDEGDLCLTLIDPQGRRIDQREAEKDGKIWHLSLGTDIIAHLEGYVVEEASPGQWQMVLKRACPEPFDFTQDKQSRRDDDGLAPVSFSAYVALESEPTLTLSTDGRRHMRGQEIIITATLASLAGPVTEAAVEAKVVRPDGSTQVISLSDDGAHYDQAAGDGVYGGIYSDADVGGYYPLFVSAHGTWQGREFERGAEMLVPVSPQSASLGLSSERIETLASTYADRGQDTDGDGRHERLLVDVGVEVTQASDFALAGTLVDSRGDEIASTVSYASLDVGSREMMLAFDGKLISDHGVGGPYRLNQVILMDVSGTAIEVDEANNVYLTGGYDYDDF
jgi:pimeloyl-ACP methyl ester carboxylesterase/sugar lactone lactonase YvrE